MPEDTNEETYIHKAAKTKANMFPITINRCNKMTKDTEGAYSHKTTKANVNMFPITINAIELNASLKKRMPHRVSEIAH